METIESGNNTNNNTGINKESGGNKMSDNATQWKKKYYDSLDDLEQKEKQWNDLEEVFKQAISRLSLAAEGNSKNLDNELGQLRTALRKGKNNRIIRTILENVTKEVIRLDKQLQSGPAGDAGLVIKLIERMNLKGKAEKKAGKFIKSLKSGNPPEQKELIERFCDLLNDVIHQAVEEAQSSRQGGAGKGGFLSGLFARTKAADNTQSGNGRNMVEEQAVPRSTQAEHSDKNEDTPGHVTSYEAEPEFSLDLEQKQLTSVVATVQNVLESIIDGLDVPQDIKEQLKDKVFNVKPTREIHVLLDDLKGILKGYGVVEQDCDELISEVSQHHELLIRLLEFLPLEDSVKAKAEELKNNFLNGVSTEQLPDALQAIAELIHEMRRNVQQEQKEFEKFLKSLTGRLKEVDQYLQTNIEEHEASYQNGIKLDNVVKDQVKGIGDSVTGLSTLKEVEHAVQSHLDKIMTHLDQHRAEENVRVARIKEQNEALSRRLKKLESQSSELRKQVLESQNKALQDPLTQLPNRMAYDQRMQQEYARWKRYHNTLLIMVWDIDFFKQVNDQYGHQAGDKVLKVVAQVLQKNLRETDFVARFGGEEFVSLMPETTLGGGYKVAEKIRGIIEKLEFHYRGDNVKVTISCGISLFVEGDTPDSAFSRADKALYQAKEQGRNRCIIAQVDSQ